MSLSEICVDKGPRELVDEDPGELADTRELVDKDRGELADEEPRELVAVKPRPKQRRVRQQSIVELVIQQRCVSNPLLKGMMAAAAEVPRDDRAVDAQSQSSDISRAEEKWSPKLEVFLRKLGVECKRRGKLHMGLGRLYETRFTALTVPGLVLNLAAAGVNSFVSVRYSTILMLLSSFVGSLHTLYQFGTTSLAHDNGCSAYEELAARIQITLAKKKWVRDAADVTILRFMNDFQNVEMAAPSL